MTFEEFIGDRIEAMSSHEYAAEKAAWEAAWDQQQRVIDEMHLAFRGHVLVPKKPSPRMIIDMAWWCRELSLSTGDLVEFWESMVKSAQELDDEH